MLKIVGVLHVIFFVLGALNIASAKFDVMDFPPSAQPGLVSSSQHKSSLAAVDLITHTYHYLNLSAREEILAKNSEEKPSLLASVTNGKRTTFGEEHTTLLVPVIFVPFYYQMPMMMGSEKRISPLIPDLTSQLTLVECKSGKQPAGVQNDVFYPNTSNSYNDSISCEDVVFTGHQSTLSQQGDKCIYNHPFEKKSRGRLAKDNFYFMADWGSRVPYTVIFGCGDHPTNLAKVKGVLGLSRGDLGLISQLYISNFSYCLRYPHIATEHNDFQFNITTRHMLQYEPLVEKGFFNKSLDNLYHLRLRDIAVNYNGQVHLVPVPPEAFQRLQGSDRGSIVINSRSLLSTLAYSAYIPFLTVLKDIIPQKNNMVFRQFDLCYPLQSRNDLNRFPTASFRFTELSLEIPAKNLFLYLEEHEDKKKVGCLAFQRSRVHGTTSLLGTALQRGTEVIFDVVNDRVAFVPGQCQL